MGKVIQLLLNQIISENFIAKVFSPLRDLESSISECCGKSIESIKDYFYSRSLEDAKQQIEEWKAEEVYSYQLEPSSTIEDAEKKVFDIVEVNINKIIPYF